MVTPYVSGSMGVGFNRARGFTITPKIIQEIPAPEFTPHTETAFTYTLGIDIQKALTPNVQVGIGYEFTDWGKSILGRGQLKL
ncbi:MAG: hypothetical protein PSV35_04360 [bacterium]|nr:hypothetical protein [bacterium]